MILPVCTVIRAKSGPNGFLFRKFSGITARQANVCVSTYGMKMICPRGKEVLAMDNEKRELSLDEMNQDSGGTLRKVNTGKAGLNAAVRSGPSKSDRQIASLENGTIVDTISDVLVFDPVAGRNFVEVTYTDRGGVSRTGWIASSILGMKR